MPTSEQHREYSRLSHLLQQVSIRHRQELPDGTTSVVLTSLAHKVRLDAYDRNGRPIGTIPDEETSSAFLNDLRFFDNVTSPDADGIVVLKVSLCP
jgi:hypothetical protein